MASEYILNEERRIREEYELKMQAEKKSGEMKKKELEEEKNNTGPAGCCTAIGIGIVLAVIIWLMSQSFGEGISAGITFLGLSAVIVFFYSQLKGEQINRKIRECADETEKRIQELEKEKEIEIIKFKEVHKKKCEERTKYYIQTKGTEKLEKWLCQKFSDQINGIDRRKHIKNLIATYHFTVEKTGIEGMNGRFDFMIERYKTLNDIYDQIGLARALGKKVQYAIQQAYKLDSTGTKTEIMVSGTDNHISLQYEAPNGKYEFPNSI